MIGGYRPAASDSVDALLVGYYGGDKLRVAGKVRAGLVAHSRRELAMKLKPLHVAACPFGDLPTTGSSLGLARHARADVSNAMDAASDGCANQVRRMEGRRSAEACVLPRGSFGQVSSRGDSDRLGSVTRS